MRRATRVYGYLRCSTDDQELNGYSLDAQREAITVEAERRNWNPVWVEDAGESAATLDRPGITRLLKDIRRGDTIVVARLDRLSRSVVGFGTLLQQATGGGWGVVALDFAMDTSTPGGELVANVLMAVAQWERRVISQRTRDGLATAKRRGVRLGQPSKLPPATRAYIGRLRAEGRTLKQIAATLTGEDVRTAAGSEVWSAQQVHRVVRAIEAEQRDVR